MYSVIIPSLGRLEYLNELLESIFQQTAPPSEILILLDDNEHCRKILNSLISNEVLHVLFFANLNLAEKRNIGASIAQCENIIFSDDDDLWAPTRGELVCKALAEAPACCHNYGKFGDVIETNCSKFGTQNRRINAKDMMFGANRFGGGSAIAAKRYIVLALPFSREFRYCEDFEWWSRVLFAGIEVRYLGASLVIYRTHATNMTNAVVAISSYGWKLCLKLVFNAFYMTVAALMIAVRSALRRAMYFLRKIENKIS